MACCTFSVQTVVPVTDIRLHLSATRIALPDDIIELLEQPDMVHEFNDKAEHSGC